MKTVKIKAADSMPHNCTQPEYVTIEISGKISDDTAKHDYDMKAVEKHFDDEAQKLFDALINALPQGVIEPLTIKFLQRRVSLYHGVMK